MRGGIGSLLVLLAACGSDKADEDTTPIDTGTSEETDTEPIDADADGYNELVDCNDQDAAIRPDADEVCDGIDNDCDDLIDDEDELAEGAGEAFPVDADGDGYGSPDKSVRLCEQTDGTVTNTDDCDDADPEVSPIAGEVCDGVDNDCDGFTDDEDSSLNTDTASLWYADTDSDGYGDPKEQDRSCAPPTGFTDNDDDCDDDNGAISPAGEEVCDDIDNDCDLLIDDEDNSLNTDTTTPWYRDADSDGYGTVTLSSRACDAPSGYVDLDTDCDDTDSAINPGVDEICDGIDNDCDSKSSEDGVVSLGDTAYASLGDALTAASDGDTLVACDGEYAEDIEIDVALTLTSLNGPDTTQITGSGARTVIRVRADLVLDGFTVTGGSSYNGGGLDAYTSGTANVSVVDCVFTGNDATIGGAIAGADAYSLTLTDSEISDNTATQIAGGVYMSDGDLINTVVTNNTAVNGGGLYVDNGTVTLDADTQIIDNDTVATTVWSSLGGGLMGEDADITLDEGTLVSGNTAEYGGGAYLFDGSSLSGGQYTDNVADVDGGGVYLGEYQNLLEDALVEGNTATYGGGIAVIGDDNALNSITVTDNSASSLGGGAFVYESNDVTVSSIDITNNSADYGGGVLQLYSTVDYSLSVFDSNQATYIGGGIYVSYDGAVLRYCDVEQNTAGESGGGATVSGGSLRSVSTDWGASSTDNSPDDVYLYARDAAYSGYSSAESFNCDDDDRECR